MPTGDEEAVRRNEQLVAQLESTGSLRDPAVAGAFRAVLRHRFLPGRPLDEVYDDSAIMTKVGNRGVPLSSSSQPTIMAIMLQLLRPQPGNRVLEVGAGTGYNAALIAHLVGPAGLVVTVDIDPELAARARANLDAAGMPGVQVRAADGATGWPAAAPYDRVIVTASTDDLAPAWTEQLAPGGRLVLPLMLAGPGQLCAAFVRQDGDLAARELCLCGFMPMRGAMRPGDPPADDDLSRWLDQEARPVSHDVPLSDLRSGFETWLALTARDYVRARTPTDESLAFGLRDEHGVALVVGSDGVHQVVTFGDGDTAGQRLAAAHDVWARERPSLDRLRIAAYPTGSVPDLGDVRIVPRPRFTFVVSSA
ncbi:MAG TPA: methyltransferase domain-containing protein [Terriglobales bacterium]|nr:methyltransferase domain-containing protein [Terriglobales bacterium]